jgi:Tfp pilus assembly ATPase PilU
VDTSAPPSFRADAGGGRFELVTALAHAVELGASDIHLKAGRHPRMRLHGELAPLSGDLEPLTPRETEQILHRVASASKIKTFESTHELDLAYTAPGVGRFRVNAYQQRGSIALVFRTVPRYIRTIKELGLPDVLLRLGEEENGIVLVTGTTSSGKSTTMAAVIEHVNQTMYKHIVAIEDPIEFIHNDAMSSVDQREVGTDTESFQGALRQVLRQDPDIIFIGTRKPFVLPSRQPTPATSFSRHCIPWMRQKRSDASSTSSPVVNSSRHASSLPTPSRASSRNASCQARTARAVSRSPRSW